MSVPVLGALALGACSSDEVRAGNGAPPETGEVSSGGADSGGAGGNAAGAPSCTATTSKAVLPALDLFLLLEASDSTYLPAAGSSTRWAELTGGLLDFFRDPASAAVGVELGFFPAPLAGVPDTCGSDAACGAGAPCQSKICLNLLVERDELVTCQSDPDCMYGTRTAPTCRTIGECSAEAGSFCFTESPDSCDGTCTPAGICSRFVSCDAEDYASPAVAQAELPDAESALSAALSARVPGDDATTAPALTATLARARAWAAANPGHEVAAVLALGGLPGACSADEATAEAAVRELEPLTREAADAGVKTHVLGVFAAGELTAAVRTSLDGVAEAGATQRAVVVDSAGDVSSQVAAALIGVRGVERGCEFQAPDATDYDAVNVRLRGASARPLVPRVPNAGSCDGARGGWHYDTEGDQPKRVVLCSTSCVELRVTPGASVELELGCPSQRLD